MINVINYYRVQTEDFKGIPKLNEIVQQIELPIQVVDNKTPLLLMPKGITKVLEIPMNFCSKDYYVERPTQERMGNFSHEPKL